MERDDNKEIHEIQTVTKDERWADLSIGDITVDSAADQSCWPQGQGDAFVTNPSKKLFRKLHEEEDKDGLVANISV